MKKTLMLVLSICTLTISYTQQLSQNSTLTKKQQREEKERVMFDKNYELLSSKMFVIENTPNSYFAVKNDSVFYQNGLADGRWFSTEGKIMGYKLMKNEKSYTCKINLWYRNNTVERKDIILIVPLYGLSSVKADNIYLEGQFTDWENTSIQLGIPLVK